MHKNKLEIRIADCQICRKPTKHQYMGNYSVQWNPVHVYQCGECKAQKQVYEKIGEPIE